MLETWELAWQKPSLCDLYSKRDVAIQWWAQRNKISFSPSPVADFCESFILPLLA